jgi:hypothetical protein
LYELPRVVALLLDQRHRRKPDTQRLRTTAERSIGVAVGPGVAGVSQCEMRCVLPGLGVLQKPLAKLMEPTHALPARQQHAVAGKALRPAKTQIDRAALPRLDTTGDQRKVGVFQFVFTAQRHMGGDQRRLNRVQRLPQCVQV